MPPLVDVVALGLLLGFSLAAPPGPMNALIAGESAVGLRRGVLTGLGAMSADAVLGVAVYASRSVVDLAAFLPEVYVVGAGVLAYFGYRSLRFPSGPSGPPGARGLRTYAAAFVLGLSNPFQILWWLTAGLAFAYLGGLPLFVGLFGAILLWVVAFPYAVHTGARREPRVARGVALASAGILIGFAVYVAVLAVLSVPR